MKSVSTPAKSGKKKSARNVSNVPLVRIDQNANPIVQPLSLDTPRGPRDRELHEAAAELGIPIEDLWRLWRATWGPIYPNAPWPKGYDSPEAVRAKAHGVSLQIAALSYRLTRLLEDAEAINS